jgi:hypothetical protein
VEEVWAHHSSHNRFIGWWMRRPNVEHSIRGVDGLVLNYNHSNGVTQFPVKSECWQELVFAHSSAVADGFVCASLGAHGHLKQAKKS